MRRGGSERPTDAASVGAQAGRPFDHRAMLALIAALSGIGLLPTGLADHQHRELAGGAENEAWAAAHIALGLMFVVCAGWHVALNRRALRNYALGLTSRAPSITREAVCAVAVVALSLLVALGHAYAGR